MSGSALKNTDTEWKVVQSGSRGQCEYENVLGTSITMVDFSQGVPELPPGFGLLSDLIDELEAEPDLREDLANARREIGAEQLGAGNESLAVLRMARGMSQSDLATALGTSQAAVSRLESGRQEPRLQMLRKLAEALGIDLNALGRAFPA